MHHGSFPILVLASIGNSLPSISLIPKEIIQQNIHPGEEVAQGF
jgi:hypothetical protein